MVEKHALIIEKKRDSNISSLPCILKHKNQYSFESQYEEFAEVFDIYATEDINKGTLKEGDVLCSIFNDLYVVSHTDSKKTALICLEADQIMKCTINTSVIESSNKRVIATTCPDFKHPKFARSFIEAYVRENGNIPKVKVVYEDGKLALNSDDTIRVHRANVFNAEAVKDMFDEFINDIHDYYSGQAVDFKAYNKFINEKLNLK